jgi:hypothetical protein
VSRAPQSFKKRDVRRAVEAVQACGLTVARVEINKDGTITVITGEPQSNTLDQNGELVL